MELPFQEWRSAVNNPLSKARVSLKADRCELWGSF